MKQQQFDNLTELKKINHIIEVMRKLEKRETLWEAYSDLLEDKYRIMVECQSKNEVIASPGNKHKHNKIIDVSFDYCFILDSNF